MIERMRLVRRHNPILTGIDKESPMTTGNGSFAFTADITGFQTLYDDYAAAHAPLCTMAQWGWHTTPNSRGGRYTLSDLKMTEYDIQGRKYRYAVERKAGNEEVYDWLRHNPHRFNLAKIALTYDDRAIKAEELSDIRQELDLYSGTLNSSFSLLGQRILVTTVCAKSADVVGFSIYNPLGRRLMVDLAFPYASHRITGSDWENIDGHTTELDGSIISRRLDEDSYFVRIYGNVVINHPRRHTFTINLEKGVTEFALGFFGDESEAKAACGWTFEKVIKDAANGWEQYWQKGGMADFSKSKDSRSFELERRIILSQYLSAVHGSGDLPPQETGLVCNSWYGKFHLEMHLIHSAHFALWGREELLEKSLGWYAGILDKAKVNAARNAFKGARWPKMTSQEGWDSPSYIATLLIWQQPHLIYMLELLRRTKKGGEQKAFINKYWPLVKETADFMASFPQLDHVTGKYHLMMPLIPAQEEHQPTVTMNPAFELCYWRFGLETAVLWAKEMQYDAGEWVRVSENLADLPVSEGLYLAHENCPDTFEGFNRDHPSMLFGCGFIPKAYMQKDILSRTFDKVKACWDFSTVWGWDFAFMAMTLVKLGRYQEAIDMLLMETEKNSYVTSGNNYQKGRTDLPAYLPGNGSLLFAVAAMLSDGVFSRAEGWQVEFERISFPL